jgi:hypothetical protein
VVKLWRAGETLPVLLLVGGDYYPPAGTMRGMAVKMRKLETFLPG